MSTQPIDYLPPPGALRAASPARAVHLISFEKGRSNLTRRKYRAWLDALFAQFDFFLDTVDCASFVVMEAAEADDTWELIGDLEPDHTHIDGAAQRTYADRLAWLTGKPRFDEVMRRDQVLPSLLGVGAPSATAQVQRRQIREVRKFTDLKVPKVLRDGVIGMAALVVCRWLVMEPRTQKLPPEVVDGLVAAWAEAQINFFAMLAALDTPAAADHIPPERRRDLVYDAGLVVRRAIIERKLLQDYREGRHPPPQLLDG